MTDREKLAGLIDEVANEDIIKRGGEWVAVINSEEIADHLLAHGVTVREPNRPFMADEAKSLVLWSTNKPPLLWIEFKDKEEMNRYVYVATIGELYQLSKMLSSYGNNVRCWAEKPTAEERKAAEWVK